jgi:N-sulfoglucosamine sulfohydrolase
MRFLSAWSCGVVLVFAAGSLGLRAADQRPNILWILGDDLGVELGCYGEPAAKTPVIDRLAAQGVRYTRCYTTAPVCSPSRSAFMTGMYAHSIGAHHHRTADAEKQPLPDGVQLLTHWFRAAGYRTANVAEFPSAFGFKVGGKTDWNFRLPATRPFDTRRWGDLKGGQPFFAQINFQEPHRLFKAPKVTDRSAIRLPSYYPDHPVAREDWAQYLDSVAELDRKVGVVLQALETEGLADSTIVVFFGDNGRCHVRDKQFCYEEGLHVPLIIRWPKNFPAPAGYGAGTVSDRLVSAVDFAPTMLALVGAAVPPLMQGSVFLGAWAAAPRSFVFGARDRCDETEMTIRTVCDARYRYILNETPDVPLLAPNRYKESQYPVWNLLKELNAQGRLTPAQAFLCAPTQPREQLFDLGHDPEQQRNLVGSVAPADQAALQRLRAALAEWRREIRDPLLKAPTGG